MNAAYQSTKTAVNTASSGNPSQTAAKDQSQSGQVRPSDGSGRQTSKNTGSGGAVSGAADWERQKQLAAAKRKLTNEFNRCEEDIKVLEERNAEIDRQFVIPENATNSFLLNELTRERSENEQKLEALLEKWEELYEKLNDDSGSML